MNDKVTIELKIDVSVKDWTEFTTDKMRFAGFEWHMTGEYNRECNCEIKKEEPQRPGSLQIRKTIIHCSPIMGKDASIWHCEVQGGILSSKGSQDLLWSHCFSFQKPQSAAIGVDFGGKFSELGMFHVNFAGDRLRCVLKLFRPTQVDFSLPDNVVSAEDVLQVIVEGKTLWLSKKTLGGASPIFQTFSSFLRRKKNSECNIENTKLSDFLFFAGIIYGLKVNVEKSSLLELLRLEDAYKCEAVRAKCRTFLMSTDTLTNNEKWQIGKRFRFTDVYKRFVMKWASGQDLPRVDLST